MTILSRLSNKSNRASGNPKRTKHSAPKVGRETFRTSREMDFFSEKEFLTQTGHEIRAWPLVFVKESMDNGLDNCEEAGIAPLIEVIADASGITVKDNGSGLPGDTLKAQMNFAVRVSSREAYVAPDRGRQGNALKTILPMPRVVDPEHGRLIITTGGKRHVITCGVDPISQQAVVNDRTENVKSSNLVKGQKARFIRGAEMRMEWGKSGGRTVKWPFDGLLPCSDEADPPFHERFHSLVEAFALFNPHATIRQNWFGKKKTWKATNANWQKWNPSRPTSAHWYGVADLERLIAACITRDRDARTDRLVSDFLAQFDGLTGSLKRAKVLAETGLKRVKLSEFVVNGHLDRDRIAKLLNAMQKHTRPVNPKCLGIIGEEHFKTRLLAMGVKSESFRYKQVISGKKSKNSQSEQEEKPSFIPCVVEVAFGYLGPASPDKRRICKKPSFFRALSGSPVPAAGQRIHTP